MKLGWNEVENLGGVEKGLEIYLKSGNLEKNEKMV